MNLLTAILTSGPMTLIIVVVALVILHKTGALDALLHYFSKKAEPDYTSRAADAGVRNDLQALFVKMDELATYANHDTTSLLTEIRDILKDNFNQIHTKHGEWDKYGIKAACRKDV